MPNYVGELEWTDGDGAKAKRVYYGVFADRAAAVAALQGLAENADVITLGEITDATLKESVDISAWTLKSTNAGDKEIQGVFIGRVTGNFRYETSLPTFNVGAYTLPGGAIDLADPDVFAFAQTGLVLGGFRDYRFTDIIAIDSAKERFG
jgi:hypothetical protein